MSAAVEAVQPPQAYPLSFIHSMVTKIAPTIDGWLPAAVHASLQELEVVVAQIAHAPPPSRQSHRGRDRHSSYQMGRSNFGSATSKSGAATGNRRQASGIRHQASGNRRQATGDR